MLTIDRIVLLYLKKRKELHVPAFAKALSIDVYKDQTTAAFQEVEERNDCMTAYIPRKHDKSFPVFYLQTLKTKIQNLIRNAYYKSIQQREEFV